MNRLAVFDTIDRLRREGAAFCVATVVRTADATSAKAGAKAAVTAAGAILGHLGGGCVQRAVRSAAAEALAADAPRMIRVRPVAPDAAADADGVASYRSGCPSGGTVEILIEPFAPAPMLAILGAGPIAEALAAHAALLGLRVVRSDPAGLAALAPGPRDFVVVASQGTADLAALRAALDSGAARVSMIASARKAASLRARLAAEGMPAPAFARLKSPAGLDLGAIEPHEIAIAVLAEIVAWRAAMRGAGRARENPPG